jgi:hypothetical protein
MKSSLVFLASLALLAPANAQQDNRVKPLNINTPVFTKEVVLTEPALRAKIAALHNAGLTHSIKGFTLSFQQRIALRDADYILCLFDYPLRAFGEAPRVLVLLTPDYKLKTWGRFTCGPFFGSGFIVNPSQQLNNTYFVTVNPEGRFGGALFFEKYLISPKGIRKLGQGYEVTKIPYS